MFKYKDSIDSIYKNRDWIYRLLLFLFSLIYIVYVLPKNKAFKYEIVKGKPWAYENLYAPFDFSILKTEQEVKQQRDKIIRNSSIYFTKDTLAKSRSLQQFDKLFVNHIYPKVLLRDSLSVSKDSLQLAKFTRSLVSTLYNKGITAKSYENNRTVFIQKGIKAQATVFGNLMSTDKILAYIDAEILKRSFVDYSQEIKLVIIDLIQKPNLILNQELTRKSLESELDKVALTKGHISKSSRIIAKGEVVEGERLQVLLSLRSEYNSQVRTESHNSWVLLGYFVFISITLTMFWFFLYQFRSYILECFNKLIFVLFNILLMVTLSSLVILYASRFIYVIPLCTTPLILKAFFDARVGLFTHIITVLIIGFIVPNGYEYMFLHIIAGIVSILTTTTSYRRANLFKAVGQITLVYILCYIAFHVIHQGNTFDKELALVLFFFVLSGLISLTAHPLVYAYEKLFGVISDVSLLELSDTNSPLLKQLSDIAPGSFHHSLNVANIAEACADQVNANVLLTRVGALYHDIGKIKRPTYFTENQTVGITPHNALTPLESAQIIINHVTDGIALAKEYNLPQSIIDFIKTHHGDRSVYYFYTQAKKDDPQVDIKDFQYPGPKPFSKETAILMMCDSIEAASKSLKNPTHDIITNFVENIINKQVEENQFEDCNITFREIKEIKKTIKQKLISMYHLRIEYPD